MKKTIRKPEDWQEFERLCKKLFGEVWGCQNTIKRNGRNGQPQSGVDVYGVPKGERTYYGIQCKGKDDYTQAQLTKKEIVTEINRARTFEPPLKFFAIATSANKDATIETFIRVQDIESRNANSFEIVYYAWEDIADLIEENRETFLWYVAEQNFRNKHDIDVTINEQQNPIIIPQYVHESITYKLSPKPDYIDLAFNDFFEGRIKQPNLRFVTRTSRSKKLQFNYAWCQIIVNVKNTGGVTIENWKLILRIEKEKIKGITKEYQGETSTTIASALNTSMLYHKQNLVLENDNGLLTYDAFSAPLVQTDSRQFVFWLRPISHEETFIKITWQAKAQDFNKEDTIILTVKPEIHQETKEVLVNQPNEVIDNSESYKERVGDKA